MAAKVLKFGFPGYIDRQGVAADTLDKTLDAVKERYNKTPLEGAPLFRTVEPKGGTYEEVTFGTVLPLPKINNDSEQIPFVGPVPGFRKKFYITEFRSGCQIERALPEDQIHPTAKRLMSGLLESGRLLMEYQMADIFNNPTSTADKYVGADGVAFASASHPHERRQTGVWSNIQTASAFTAASFSAARTSMRRRKNEFNDPMPITPVTVYCSPEIETQVRTVLGSERTAGGALNDTNVYKNAVDVKVMNFWTSTTQWCLKGDIPNEYCGLLYMPSVMPGVAPTEGRDRSTDIIWSERLRMRHAFGYTVDKNWEINLGL
jgi:hypothetical protein